VGCGQPLSPAAPSEPSPPTAPGGGYPPPVMGAGSGDAWPPAPPPGPGGPYGDPGAPPPGGAYPPPAGPQPPMGGYPPGGAPPGYGPAGTGGYPGQPPAKRRSPALLALAIIVVLGLVGAATFLVLTKDEGEELEVVLEPVGLVQEDDFAGNLDVGEAAGASFSALEVSDEVPDARVEQVDTGLAGRVVDGVEPGVYGGSRDTQVCDVVTLTSFLTDPANADKAEAWAGVLDIDVADIESYISGLTAVRLRWDTRVTNHGFRDGEANGFQSLLQAGTAVLVDDTGVPRVKCNCGNPLGEPTALDGPSESEALALDDIATNPDDAWEGLDPAQAVAVEPGSAAVESITLVDVDSGGLIERPVGSDGASKRDTGTGDVQVTLEWGSSADIDLAVTEPDGTTVYFNDKGPTASGGQLDVDSNVGCEDDDGIEGAVENVFWPTGAAPPGTYAVTVTGYSLTDGAGASCGSGDFTLTITVGGTETVQTGTVAQDEEVTFSFEVS